MHHLYIAAVTVSIIKEKLSLSFLYVAKSVGQGQLFHRHDPAISILNAT